MCNRIVQHRAAIGLFNRTRRLVTNYFSIKQPLYMTLARELSYASVDFRRFM